MSYDIYFIRSKEVNTENVEDYLESEPTDADEHYISKETMVGVKTALEGRQLKFETFEGDRGDYLELNFETYQVEIMSSQIALTLPYWDANGSDEVNREVGVITEVLAAMGFTGYDPQTGGFLSDDTTFATDFNRADEKVKEHFSPELSHIKTREGWRLIKMGIVILITIVVIRLLFSLVGKFL